MQQDKEGRYAYASVRMIVRRWLRQSEWIAVRPTIARPATWCMTAEFA